MYLVHLGRGRVVEQVEHPLADQHVLPQRHRPVFADHHPGLAAHGDQPVGELLGVGHGGRQRHQRHRLRQVDDHLFPDRATEPVGQVVHLVHDHVAQVTQGVRAGVEHVAQHLGGHHHDRGVPVDRVVAGEQADLVRPVLLDQVVVLLVGQRLDRRRVEALAPLGQREMDRELAHHRLASPGRSAHQHPTALLQGLAGVPLERVELEAQPLDEVAEGRHAGVLLGPPAGRRVPLGRAGS